MKAGARMKLKASLFLVFVLLIVSGFLGGLPRVHASGSSFSSVSISPIQTSPSVVYQTGQTFSVSVDANILSGQSVQGFDVLVNYTNPEAVLQATGIDYSTNIFASQQNSGPLVECIDGISKLPNAAGCAGEGIGQVHFTESILGPAMVGPVSGELFKITFSVNDPGTSVFFIVTANISNPNPDPSNPEQFHFTFIPLLLNAGVFGNQGVVAFFNFQPQDTSVSPSQLPNQAVLFDASTSFVPGNSSDPIRSYSWDFGDGGKGGNSSIITHSFTKAGNFTVSLTVWDQKNVSGSVMRQVTILPALGGLALTVDDQGGNPQRGNVLVRLFNSSVSGVPFVSKMSNEAGGVTFDGLAPGNYYLTFLGVGVVNSSRSERVIPGWTTRDTVYVALVPPPPDYSGLIYIGAIVGALAVVTGAIVYQRWRSAKSRAKGSASRRGSLKSRGKSALRNVRQIS